MYVFFRPFLPSRLTRFLEICISRFCAVLRQLLLCPEILFFVHGPPSNSNFLLCVAVLTGKKIAEKRDDAIKSRINSFIYSTGIYFYCAIWKIRFSSVLCRFYFYFASKCFVCIKLLAKNALILLSHFLLIYAENAWKWKWSFIIFYYNTEILYFSIGFEN